MSDETAPTRLGAQSIGHEWLARTRGCRTDRQNQLIARRTIAERSLPEAEAGAGTFGGGRRRAPARPAAGGDGRARCRARLQRRRRGDVEQPRRRLEARFLQALRQQGGVFPRHLRHHRQPLGARDPRRRRGRGGVVRATSARVSRLRRPDRQQPRGGAAGPGRGLRRRRRRGRADAAYEPALRGAGGEEPRLRRRGPPAAAAGGQRHRRRWQPGGAGAAALWRPAAAGARRGRADGVGALLLRRRRRPPARPRGRGGAAATREAAAQSCRWGTSAR